MKLAWGLLDAVFSQNGGLMLFFSFSLSFVCLFVSFSAGDKLEQYGVSPEHFGRWFQPKWRMKAAVRQAFQ